MSLGLLALAGATMLADAAVFLLSRTQLEDVLDKGKAKASIRWFCGPFLRDGESLSICCALLSLISLMAYLLHGTVQWHLVSGYPLGYVIVALCAPLLLITLPLNSFARLRTEEAVVSMVRPLWFLTLPVRPIGTLVMRAERRLNEALSTEDEDDSEEREEIIAAVTDGEHEGVVAEQEREMIVNIFDLKETDVSDIMTPRTDLCSIAIEAAVSEAIDLARERGFSRIPVFEETRDDIKGIFFVKDALDHWQQPADSLPPLRELMRPPIFVPESKSVAELMRELQQKKMHMAIVLDEYGGTAGLVTIEDVVEEIVGEIQDEYDPEETVNLRALESGKFEVESRTHVHDMNEALGRRALPEDEDYETVGGFILNRLGHVPQAREVLTWEDLRFTILSADERRIGHVQIEVLPEEEPDEEDFALAQRNSEEQ